MLDQFVVGCVLVAATSIVQAAFMLSGFGALQAPPDAFSQSYDSGFRHASCPSFGSGDEPLILSINTGGVMN
ncbi:MAG: hypothetical protein ACXWIH_08055, partial [Burkholderiales bacterium]